MTELKNTQQPKLYNVLIIGDNCIDEYRIGTVDRLSPEAPVPIIKIVEEYSIPGMAGNVNLNFKKLGINADFVCNQEKIIKTRYIDKRSGQHLLRVDKEPVINPWNLQTPQPVNNYDAVVVSDYNKGFLTYEHIEWLIKQSKGTVFVDTKKSDLSKFQGAVLKINETEYNSRKSINDRLIVTLGDRGAMYKTYDNEKLFQINPAPVVDVCGCGDTFLAALVYQFLLSSNIELAIQFANKAAGVTVQKQGNYAPSLGEINGY